ncbi:MAG: ECF-type riboflavin transporter substrate-binding protein [Erysipelotrichaceae bacterium]|nr:ECF-type riboflavin transporter substrate-binding protein [Erysipelotrichaceae bacterium]
MKKNLFSTKTIVAIGIGAALFFVIGKFVYIPSGIPNTTIALQYAVLAFLSALYGPVAGCLIGFIGHWLIDLTAGWGVWWSWVIGSAIHGAISGIVFNKVSLNKGNFGKKEILTFVVVNLIASVLAWGLFAPIGDIVIYSEPVSYVFTQGLVAGLANFVVSTVVGGLLCFAYTKTVAKEGSLDKE